MPRGCPATGREEYMRIKLHKDTYHLWNERKRILQLKSDNELALHLLELPRGSHSAVRDTRHDRSQEHETMPVPQSIELLRDQNMLNPLTAYMKQCQIFPLFVARFLLEMARKKLPQALLLGIHIIKYIST